MPLDLSPVPLVRAGAGLLLAGLAVYLVVASPRRRQDIGLALALGGLGLRVIVSNLFGLAGGGNPDPAVVEPALLVGAAFDLVAVAGGLLLVSGIGDRTSRAAGYIVALLLPGFGIVNGSPPVPGAAQVVADATTVLFLAMLGSGLGVAFAYGLATRHVVDGDEAIAAALVAAPVVLYPAFYSVFIALEVQALGGPAAWILMLPTVAVALAWLLVAKRHGAVGRNVALLALGAAVAGAVDWSVTDGTGSVAAGIVRVLAFALVVHGILSHRLLGRDLAIPTARRGTLAAAALVGFFVVAQIAQEYLSGTMGVILGGVAAGVLLFAAAPLQRAVEGLAGRQVAIVDPGRGASAHAEDAYRDALRLAMHDGAITPEEERHLASLADRLGVTYGQAVRLRAEVDVELRGAR